MNTKLLGGRRLTLTLAGLIATASMAVTLAVSNASGHTAEHHHHHHGHAVTLHSSRQVAFHDAMRSLWETHGAWTHMVIVSFAGNLPNLAAEEQILLQNQVNIGNAVKPFYGTAAGEQLTKLLKEHILGAVAVLQAAKSGNQANLSAVEASWFANGRQIGDFLAAANPRHLSRAAAELMMKTHLEQVIEQGVDELKGDYAADAQAYEPYIRHILEMADMISNGIIQQFPGRFR
ncbi:MAG TPA: hypothetical protein VFW29_08430 [Solirubrobacteraceae bacterium]|nr:hypothetical protein [Solirubrobacteraceae bacterium]